MCSAMLLTTSLELLQMPKQGFQSCKYANLILGVPYSVHSFALAYSGSNFHHIIVLLSMKPGGETNISEAIQQLGY